VGLLQVERDMRMPLDKLRHHAWLASAPEPAPASAAGAAPPLAKRPRLAAAAKQEANMLAATPQVISCLSSIELFGSEDVAKPALVPEATFVAEPAVEVLGQVEPAVEVLAHIEPAMDMSAKLAPR